MRRTNRKFIRIEPERDAKIFYLFCEGNKREIGYFKYFVGISSKIKIKPILPNLNNSPTGLYKKAGDKLSDDLRDSDEVWFVIDTDKWGEKIDELKRACKKKCWDVAQSNPCFEVWLYYHFKETFKSFEGCEKSKAWKTHVNILVTGGFDSRKHSILIHNAIQNAKKNYKEENEKPLFASTQVFRLAENIYPFVQEAINKELESVPIS